MISSIFLVIWPLIIVLLISLIVSIAVVLRWNNRPKLALITALTIYLAPLILLIGLTVIGGHTRSQGLSLTFSAVILGAVWLIIGFLILVPVQWKSLRSEKKRAQMKIGSTF